MNNLKTSSSIEIYTSTDFRIELKESGIAILWFSCAGKSNVLGRSTMLQLQEIVKIVREDERVKALIMASAKPDSFVVGADLHEILSFDSSEQAHALSRDGQLVFNEIEQLSKPTIAAIHGACLGGGLEAALTAHFRVASDDPLTIIGLPEVRLGLIPGLGGTQRLPRLIAAKQALEMILTAEPVSAARALELGIVDEVVPQDKLLERAEALAQELVCGKGPKRLPKEAEKPEKLKTLFATMERSFRIRFKGNYPAPLKAIEAVKISQAENLDQGLKFEAASFAELAVGNTSHNLIAIFFSQDFTSRSAAKTAEKNCKTPLKVLGVVGSGVMGTELIKVAQHSLPGLAVRIKTSKEERAKELAEQFRENPLVKVSSQIDVLADCDLVIEAIVEDTQLKRNLLKEVETAVRADCVIATNTSSIELIELGQDLLKPERFVGTHFFHPIDKMQLVEVISHPSTNQAATAAALSFVTKLGKTPIAVKDSAAFLVNRILCLQLLEAARMLEQGVPFNWIEDAAIQFGLPMGPFTLLDELGLSLSYSVASRLEFHFGERAKSPQIMYTTRNAGFNGREGGHGLYLWENARKTEVNPAFLKTNNLSLSPEKPSAEQLAEIQDRLIMPMIDEAARCLEEKVVRKPRELDLAMVIGTGFPAFRGGPLRYADQLTIATVIAKIEKVYELSQFPRQVSSLLRSMNESGRRFYSSAES